MKVTAVIPARYNSSRMPGKPLADIHGRPMIWWVYQQVQKNRSLHDIIVATDDPRIFMQCRSHNMNVLMTSEEHKNPTSRLHEVSTKINSDLYLMVMGDEPLVNEACFSLIIPPEEEKTGEYYVAALTNVLNDPAEVIDFSNQKVVTDANRNALLISRSPIPYPKGSLDIQYEKVTGVQIFSKKSLDFFSTREMSLLEQTEENDLLRFIEGGIPVKMIPSGFKTISVDTFKDLQKVRQMLAKK